MQPIDNDYLNQRLSELDVGRSLILERVQTWLDQNYPGKSRALSFNQGVLKLISPSASVAGDLRLRQIEIIKLAPEAKRLQIQIRPLH